MDSGWWRSVAPVEHLGCPANCLNGAVITLDLNYLIGPLFMFLVSLICVNNYYHCNEKNNKMRKKKK